MSDPKPPLSIMLVDDNRDAVRLLGALLERSYGFRVRVTFSGQEALDALVDFKPDVFVIDISGLYMSGLELARIVRGMPVGKSALLLAVSGWTRDGEALASSEAGFDYRLTKPLETDVLVSTIRAWASERCG